MEEPKKRNIFKRIIDNYDPRVIKKRFNTLQASPYKAIKFQYRASLLIILVVCAVIIWQLVSLIINYPGTGWVALMGRGAILVVGVMIVIKAFGVLTPLKKILEHYEKTPTTQGTVKTKEINVTDEIDDILAKYDKDKKVVKK